MRLPLLGFMALGLAAGAPPSVRVADADEYDGTPPGFHTLHVGDPAPDFSLLGIDGRTYSLADFRDAPYLIVVFLSNHCPSSHAAETRFIPFVAGLKGKGVAVVAINPNSLEGLRIDELGYSKYSDSYEDMKLYAQERGFNFPYLYDGATQKTAMAYGCLCTPHLFIFDQGRHLRYKGRFDDSQTPDPASVHSTDGANAVEALLAGRPVPVEVTRPMGCSTKWLTKRGEVAEGNEAWKNMPVSIEPIDAGGIAELARNSTDRLRVINLWATWCVPCVEEFPGLVSISRRLNSRDFDLITISVDDPKDSDKALRFLERQHAAVPPGARAALAKEGRRTNNYHYTGQSSDALAQALDPQWGGGCPYTVVIAPGGKVLYRYSGSLDVAALQSRLIDTLGIYYK
ncbi:MAG TPA: redoxin domain-containing protein [Opitutaceae bacterium]|nr:redoxin domain-containing protein [Opitutaceae bacterium]